MQMEVAYEDRGDSCSESCNLNQHNNILKPYSENTLKKIRQKGYKKLTQKPVMLQRGAFPTP